LGRHEWGGFMLADNAMDIHLPAGDLGHRVSAAPSNRASKVICSEAIWRVVDRRGLGITDDTIVARLLPRHSPLPHL
jgi:hypothetical protein